MPKRNTKPTGKRLDGTHYQSDKTHCIRGHPLSGDNVIVRHDASHENGRMCRTCSRLRARIDSRVRYWRWKLAAHTAGPHNRRGCDECALIHRTLGGFLQQLQNWRKRKAA